jgi:hypothetical protein
MRPPGVARVLGEAVLELGEAGIVFDNQPPSEWVRRKKRTVLVVLADCAFLWTMRLGTVVYWRYGMDLPLESSTEVQGGIDCRRRGQRGSGK